MTVSDFLKRAQNSVIIRKIIIWNPYISKALYCGSPLLVPEKLIKKEATAYRYDKDKQRMIIRITSS